MEFKNPLVFILIPVVCLWWWRQQRKQERGAFTFSSTKILGNFTNSWKIKYSVLPQYLRLMALVMCILALAGPRRVLDEVRYSTNGIDIVIALDCSGSMAAEDFKIDGKRLSRFDVVKKVVEEFIQMRPHDQLGLIAFAGRAYTVCPLTTDRQWLLANLERLQLGIIEDGTAIGSGIASSLSRLKESQGKSKVIILLTDGVNNAGSIDPQQAAKAAAAMGVKVYTIGAAAEGWFAPYPRQDMFGRKYYQNIQIEIDEAALKSIADTTKAQYFRATDTDSLRSIYKSIDSLEKTKIEQKGYKQYAELFVYCLGAALLLVLLELVLANTIFLKVP